MEENQTPPNKQDMVDRKAAWIERMFDRLFTAIQKDVKGTLLILSVGFNFYLANLYIDLNKSSKEEMISEVRKSARVEVSKQLAPIQAQQQAQQDSATVKLDTSLSNLDGTVKTLKEYFNKNKRK